MPIKLLITEHPVNPDSSVPQAGLQPDQWGSKSSFSLDGQGGEHAVLHLSGRMLASLSVVWSVMLQKKGISAAEG